VGGIGWKTTTHPRLSRRAGKVFLIDYFNKFIHNVNLFIENTSSQYSRRIYKNLVHQYNRLVHVLFKKKNYKKSTRWGGRGNLGFPTIVGIINKTIK